MILYDIQLSVNGAWGEAHAFVFAQQPHADYGVANWIIDLRPHFGEARYTSGGAAATARAALVSYGWTITDGGVA